MRSAVNFPSKLHYMLSEVEKDGLAHIVSWHPHGRSFAIHKPDVFVTDIIGRYFQQTKLTSFIRQLNIYGFTRITGGPENNGYYHECFLRGKIHLTYTMPRMYVKGTHSRRPNSSRNMPDFYNMLFLADSPVGGTTDISDAPAATMAASIQMTRDDIVNNKNNNSNDVNVRSYNMDGLSMLSMVVGRDVAKIPSTFTNDDDRPSPQNIMSLSGKQVPTESGLIRRNTSRSLSSQDPIEDRPFYSLSNQALAMVLLQSTVANSDHVAATGGEAPIATGLMPTILPRGGIGGVDTSRLRGSNPNSTHGGSDNHQNLFGGPSSFKPTLSTSHMSTTSDYISHSTLRSLSNQELVMVLQSMVTHSNRMDRVHEIAEEYNDQSSIVSFPTTHLPATMPHDSGARPFSSLTNQELLAALHQLQRASIAPVSRGWK